MAETGNATSMMAKRFTATCLLKEIVHNQGEQTQKGAGGEEKGARV